MPDFQLYLFQSHKIRVLLIGGEPWFVGKDVLDVIELPSQAYAMLKPYEKLNYPLLLNPLNSQNGDNTCISESGLSRLLVTSHKPQAEPFQDWVVQDVLPSIRKIGSYSVHSQPLTVESELPINKQALEISRDVREIIDNLVDNPRLAQFLVDLAISDVMPSGHTLEPSKLKSASEIAFSLGFPVDLENLSSLDRFVRRYCGHLSTQLERFVDGEQNFGTYYPKDNFEVVETIIEFFS